MISSRAVCSRDAQRGSSLPFVLVCWLVAALMVFGGITASQAFLAQQDVQSVCDAAALAGADRADEDTAYRAGVTTSLPLSRDGAETAIAEQLSGAGIELDSWSVATDGVEVTVRCTRYVRVAFDWLFLAGQPLERTAVASARAPTA